VLSIVIRFRVLGVSPSPNLFPGQSSSDQSRVVLLGSAFLKSMGEESEEQRHDRKGKAIPFDRDVELREPPHAHPVHTDLGLSSPRNSDVKYGRRGLEDRPYEDLLEIRIPYSRLDHP
jgi:hypothetical protein